MSRLVNRRSAGVVALATPLVTAALLVGGGPAGALPVEGDPDRNSCVRIVHRSVLWPDEPDGIRYVGLPHVSVLVPRAEC
jgi:hypothetical protein